MVKLFLPVPHPVWKMIPKRNMFSNLFHKIQSILARVNPNVFVSSTWFRWSWVETTQDDFTRLAIFSGSKVATSSPNQSFRTKLTENIRKYQPTFNQPWFREIQESLRPYIKTIENTVFFFRSLCPPQKSRQVEVMRVQCRAIKDDVEGWATVSGTDKQFPMNGTIGGLVLDTAWYSKQFLNFLRRLWLSLRRYIWHPKSWSVSKLIFLAILKFLEAWSPSKTSQLEPFEPFEPESSQNRVARLDALKWWGDPKVITHQMTCHFRAGDLWFWAAGLR